jgi:ATP-dependent Lon protease
MTGEITIMGKVLAIGGVLPKLQAAIEAGCTEVLMPKENERDVQMTPDYVKNKIKVRFVSSIDEVLAAALLECSTVQ